MTKLCSRNKKIHRKRMIKDRLARYMVGLGGISVIFAIALIFFYFIYVVVPMFEPASQEKVAEYSQADQQSLLAMSMEEQAEIAVSFSSQGDIHFWSTANGKDISSFKIPVPAKAVVSSLALTNASQSSVLFGFSNGEVYAAKYSYKTSYPND
ncbi:MAG: phosphate ABC transporter permease, partial [Gammaproteobacteria bacterium]|nr:phosphate ABC transporter permease [Gammaproteobacteria bacterium]